MHVLWSNLLSGFASCIPAVLTWALPGDSWAERLCANPQRQGELRSMKSVFLWLSKEEGRWAGPWWLPVLNSYENPESKYHFSENWINQFWSFSDNWDKMTVSSGSILCSNKHWVGVILAAGLHPVQYFNSVIFLYLGFCLYDYCVTTYNWSSLACFDLCSGRIWKIDDFKMVCLKAKNFQHVNFNGNFPTLLCHQKVSNKSMIEREGDNERL